MLHAEAGMAEQSGLVLGVPEHLIRDRPRLIRSSSVPGMTAGYLPYVAPSALPWMTHARCGTGQPFHAADRADALKVTLTMVMRTARGIACHRDDASSVSACRRRHGPSARCWVVSTRGGAYEANTPGAAEPALPPELAAHPDDSAAYEDWRAWRQRRRTWFTEHRLSYDFSEDLRLRRFVRHSGGSWIQPNQGSRRGRRFDELRDRDLP